MDRRRQVPVLGSLVDRPVGIYAGAGASHSWTWLVDCLEEQGVPHLRLLDEGGPAAGGLDGLSSFLVGGGDPQAMAAGMGPAGADALRAFVEEGGLYVGFCAGAYLPIPLGLPVMDPFAMTGVRLGNVVDSLPPARALPTKLATPYEDRWVLHPAREGLVLRSAPSDLRWPDSFEVPLYGGAPMILGDEEEALAYFAGFTPRTLFLVDEELAERILVGAVAACRRRVGRGGLYLFAPHLENPHYRAGHPLLVRLLEERSRPTVRSAAFHPGSCGGRPDARASAGPAEMDQVRRYASEARIVAFALEFEDLSWRLGEKYYEPAKIVVLLDALWRRLDRRGSPALSRDETERLSGELGQIVELLRTIKRDVAAGRDTQTAAESLFPLLGGAVRRFVDAYLKRRADSVAGASAA